MIYKIHAGRLPSLGGRVVTEKCGLIGEDVFYAHGIHFSDVELEILRSTGTTIAHCLSSNMRLGSGTCRV
ncbi:MAG: hypothetical protein ACI4M4_05005 [Candidatus Ornithospirochaeta sp.]